MRSSPIRLFLVLILSFQLVAVTSVDAAFDEKVQSLKIAGMAVTEHQVSSEMRYRRPPDPTLSARVELFVQNPTDETIRLSGPVESGPANSVPVIFDEVAPGELVSRGQWAWRDPSWENGFELPGGALRVLRWNGQSQEWGVGTDHTLRYQVRVASGEGQSAQMIAQQHDFRIAKPELWIESVVFHAREDAVRPESVSITLRNAGSGSRQLRSVQLWLPKDASSFETLYPQGVLEDIATWTGDRSVPGGELIGFTIATEMLPLTFVAIEVALEGDAGEVEKVWGYLKVRPARFDISGGWIASNGNEGSSLANEEYLKTLTQLSVNTGQIEEVGGYSDNSELVKKYPMKRFNRLGNRERYDKEEMVSGIHAVEFLGEPQYGGGRPVPPQEVFDKLAPYASWILPTSVTLSEERTWRYYSGLSDYPHYDAYRVIAPAADAWSRYDRWDGKSIRWGAPLETIGTMTRSLRELSRPATIAYWSQGAHDGWGGVLSPRRGSPTAQELRAQAWQGLGNGIASLYWFNLSMKSLAKYPDLLEPIARIGIEIGMLKPILERGTAYRYQRITTDGKPQWDLSSVVSSQAAMLVVNDLGYRIDEATRTFRFDSRKGQWEFDLPIWLHGASKCYRVDADGVHDVQYRFESGRVVIEDNVDVVGIYVVAKDSSDGVSLRETMELTRKGMLERNGSLGFNPIANREDLKKLQKWVD